MCGRYTLTIDIDNIFAHFGIEIYEDRGLNPQYNIAPTHKMPVITAEQQVKSLPWGIKHNNHFVINVRSEGRFRQANTWNRCLIPADGYFEWRLEKGRKQPYYFQYLKQPWFVFAGLYQTGKSPGYTILTMPATAQVQPYHHRMPILLTDDSQFESWLQENRTPLAIPELSITAVNPIVNNVRNNSPQCIEPVRRQQLHFGFKMEH